MRQMNQQTTHSMLYRLRIDFYGNGVCVSVRVGAVEQAEIPSTLSMRITQKQDMNSKENKLHIFLHNGPLKYTHRRPTIDVYTCIV